MVSQGQEVRRTVKHRQQVVGISSFKVVISSCRIREPKTHSLSSIFLLALVIHGRQGIWGLAGVILATFRGPHSLEQLLLNW